MFNIKTISTASFGLVLALGAWTASFNHSNMVKFEVKPEWNGPDYLVTYKCPGAYERMEGLSMKRKGENVTVNYGALGRRRKGRIFHCFIK